MRQAAAVVLALALGILTTPPVAQGAEAGKVKRIGVLSPAYAPSGPSPRFEAFRQRLRELGWEEGRTVAIEYRWAEGNLDRLPDLAGELVRLKVDVIIAINSPATRAAKGVTSIIPIVFTGVAEIATTGLVAGLARPGGNITGVSTMAAEMSGKRLQLLREVLPKASRAAVLWHTPSYGAATSLKEMEAASRHLRLQLQNVGVRSPDEFQSAMDAAIKGRARALLVIDDLFITSHRTRILQLAQKSRLPVFSIYSDFAEAGGLLAYGPSGPDTYRSIATLVDKILRGAKPADLPVEQPTRFEMVINLKTAKALGLKIPPTVLVQANRVIE